jgi:mannose-6-phosphate isomerase
VYPVPAPEFELSRLEWAAGEAEEVHRPGGLPQILVCTRGAVGVLPDGGAERELPRGRSLWIPASDPKITVRPFGGATAQAFLATVGS